MPGRIRLIQVASVAAGTALTAGTIAVAGPAVPAFAASTATVNGGTTWRPTAAIVTRSTWPLVWGWPDTRHGFESDGRKLDTTANGGHTWRVMALPKKIRPVSQIDFGTRSIGWAIVYGKLWKTRNGGHAWTKLTASLVSP